MPTATSRDGTPISFDKVGAGPGIILVPPAIQFRAIDPGVAELARLLADDFTVVTYDRRGRGESGDAPAYEVSREIDDLAVLIEAAGGRASLYGLSSGALLALEAVAAGLPVDRLAIYEPPLAVAGSRPPFAADYVAKLDRHLADGDRDAAATLFFSEGVMLPAEVIAGMKQSPFWPVVTGIAHTLRYDARIVTGAHGDAGLAARFDAISTPVLAIDGDASEAWLRRSTEIVGERLGAARATLLGQDHGPKPEVIAPVLMRFFAG